MSELEKERIRTRDMTQAIELTTGLQKQRQTEERAELMRERDFLEKLRLQFLCPACLRLVRSQGDGVDTSTVVGTCIPVPAHHHKPPQYSVSEVSPAGLDIEREGRQLNQMIANYYGHL